MRTGSKTINNRLLSLGYHTYSPTRKLLLSGNHRRLHLAWAQNWQNLTITHWQKVIFGDESRFQIYRLDWRIMICRLSGERFQQRCQAHRVQTGGGSVHVLGAFHSGAMSPLVLPDRYLTSELYRGTLRNTLVTYARQHFGDNYHYQDDNATLHHTRVVLNSAGRYHQDGRA